MMSRRLLLCLALTLLLASSVRAREEPDHGEKAEALKKTGCDPAAGDNCAQCTCTMYSRLTVVVNGVSQKVGKSYAFKKCSYKSKTNLSTQGCLLGPEKGCVVHRNKEKFGKGFFAKMEKGTLAGDAREKYNNGGCVSAGGLTCAFAREDSDG